MFLMNYLDSSAECATSDRVRRMRPCGEAVFTAMVEVAAFKFKILGKIFIADGVKAAMRLKKKSVLKIRETPLLSTVRASSYERYYTPAG